MMSLILVETDSYSLGFCPSLACSGTQQDKKSSARRAAAEIINPFRRYRWSLPLWLMVNWGTAEPWAQGTLNCSARYASMWGAKNKKNTLHSPCLSPSPRQSAGLSRGRRQWSRIGPAAWLVGSWCGCPRRGWSAACRPLELSVQRNTVIHVETFNKDNSKAVWQKNVERMRSYIEHRWGDGTRHWVSSKGVEMNPFTEGSCNF